MAAVDLITDQEIDAALERSRNLPDLPTAVSARYVSDLDAIVIDLEGGRRLLLPRAELQGLESASYSELSEIEIHAGVDIAWPKLDVDHYLPALLSGSYGSAKWMRRLELQGVPDTPLNSPSAIARHRLAAVSYSLFEPSSHVEGRVLRKAVEVRRNDIFAALDLHFETNVLRLAAVPCLDEIEMTLLDASGGAEVPASEAMQGQIGAKLGYIWIAPNQQGYLDTVLLGFSSVVIPDIAITAVASELKVRVLAG